MSSFKNKAIVVIFSALLLGGFPNFVMQEAHAAAPTMSSAATVTTTTVQSLFQKQFGQMVEQLLIM